MLQGSILRLAAQRAIRPSTLAKLPYPQRISSSSRPLTRLPHTSKQTRTFSISATQKASEGKTTVDEKMEELTELYSEAKDEFEIAAEETEKMTVYAQDDREAAREALTELQDAYKAALNDASLAEEVTKRVGPRIRELENAVTAMEEMAQNQD